MVFHELRLRQFRYTAMSMYLSIFTCAMSNVLMPAAFIASTSLTLIPCMNSMVSTLSVDRPSYTLGTYTSGLSEKLRAKRAGDKRRGENIREGEMRVIAPGDTRRQVAIWGGTCIRGDKRLEDKIMDNESDLHLHWPLRLGNLVPCSCSL